MEPTDAQCQYRVVVETEVVDLASTLLATFTDCLGTELVDAEVEAGTDDEERRHDAGTVVAYYRRSRPEAAPEIRADVTDALRRLEGADWRIADCERFTDESWKERWKEYFEPLCLSERIGVGPPWRSDDIPEPDSGTGLVVEPGMAFGTGQHETTQLTAQLLDDHLARRESTPSVLDVGCGSGILSMSAAQLGASPVHGIDVEDEAVDAARKNLARNGFDEDVDVSTTPLESIEATFELVLANLLAPILLELRESLVDRVDSGGRLLVSGVTSDRSDAFLDEFVPGDWQVEQRRRKGEWMGYVIAPEDDSSQI